MPNVRPLNQNKYQISKYRFLEIYNFCLQYNEWKDELKYNTHTVGAQEITGMPFGTEKSDSTAHLAMKRIELERKCQLIERTAMEADSEIYPYILKAVTNEYVTYHYLKNVMDIPCGKDRYYDRRRKFYYLMSNKKI